MKSLFEQHKGCEILFSVRLKHIWEKQPSFKECIDIVEQIPKILNSDYTRNYSDHNFNNTLYQLSLFINKINSNRHLLQRNTRMLNIFNNAIDALKRCNHNPDINAHLRQNNVGNVNINNQQYEEDIPLIDKNNLIADLQKIVDSINMPLQLQVQQQRQALNIDDVINNKKQPLQQLYLIEPDDVSDDNVSTQTNSPAKKQIQHFDEQLQKIPLKKIEVLLYKVASSSDPLAAHKPLCGLLITIRDLRKLGKYLPEENEKVIGRIRNGEKVINIYSGQKQAVADLMKNKENKLFSVTKKIHKAKIKPIKQDNNGHQRIEIVTGNGWKDFVKNSQNQSQLEI